VSGHFLPGERAHSGPFFSRYEIRSTRRRSRALSAPQRKILSAVDLKSIIAAAPARPGSAAQLTTPAP